MDKKEYRQASGNRHGREVSLPPAWCAELCRQAINEVCIESCSIRRDCSGFEMKKGLRLEEMSHYPLGEFIGEMTPKERTIAIGVYVFAIVENLKEGKNGRVYLYDSGNSQVFENQQKQNLFVGKNGQNPLCPDREEREDPGKRPAEVVAGTGLRER
jgi:hypothetical protein